MLPTKPQRIMTTEQKKQIADINAWFDGCKAVVDERRNYRMENYYNCIDDYSWGGLCDKADNEYMDRLRVERDIKIEQVKNGGCYYRTSDIYRLVDGDGNQSDGCGCGEYGYYWRMNGRFVGLPKRIATLAKKGFRLERVEREFRCVIKCVTDKGNIRNQSVELMSETITEVTQDTMPSHLCEDFLNWEYENFFINK